MNPGKDPYFVHYYRINFDGTGLTPLTEARRATTPSTFSADMAVTTSTPTRASTCRRSSELRRASDGSS